MATRSPCLGVSDMTEEEIALTPEEKAEELAFDIGTAYSLLSNVQVARAALAFVSLDLLVLELQRRGHQVCLHTICGLGKRDALPLGYPPLADYDDESLPFDMEREMQEGRG